MPGFAYGPGFRVEGISSSPEYHRVTIMDYNVTIPYYYECTSDIL